MEDFSQELLNEAEKAEKSAKAYTGAPILEEVHLERAKQFHRYHKLVEQMLNVYAEERNAFQSSVHFLKEGDDEEALKTLRQYVKHTNNP